MLSKRTAAKLCSAWFLLALVFVAFFGAYSGTYSQQNTEPEKTQSNEAGNAGNSVNEQDDNAQQSVSIIETAPSPKAEDDGAAKREETLNDITLVLAIIAALQLAVFAWQGIQLQRTVNVSVAAERASMAMAGARCNFQPTYKNIAVEDIMPTIPHAAIGYVNIGKSTARIHQTRLEILIRKRLPDRPIWGESPIEVSHGYIIIGPSKTSAMDRERTWDRALTREEAEGLKNETLTVFLIGTIAFQDTFDFMRTYVFAMKRKPNGELVPTRGKAYNRHYKGIYPKEK